MQFLPGSLLELITQTSTNLPADVRAAMSMASESETPNTQSAQALNIIMSNIDMAADDEGPICQDTGMPTFLVHTPIGVNQIRIRKAIREAVADAAREAAAQFGRFADGQEQRRQPGSGDAGDSFRSVGTGRDRDQADPQRR